MTEPPSPEPLLPVADPSHDPLRSILEGIPDLVFVLSADGRYLEVFTAEHELLIAPVEELKQTTIHEALPPPAARYIQNVISETLECACMQEIEYALDLGQGRAWFSARVIPYAWAGGPAVMWVARDVSGRVRAELALKETLDALDQRVRIRTGELAEANQQLRTEMEERARAEAEVRRRLRFEQLVASVATRCVQEDPAGSLRWSLEALGRHLGARRAGILVPVDEGSRYVATHTWPEPPADWEDFEPGWVVEGSAEEAAERLEERVRAARPWLVERPEGSLQTWLGAAAPLLCLPLYADGRALGVLVVQRAEAPAEPETRAATDAWGAERVERFGVLASVLASVLFRMDAEERRRQLELRFLQAQKLESLGIMAGGVAHDFNNLLTAILGNASLLAEQVPDEEARDAASEIVEVSRRASELTEQLLAYAGRGGGPHESVDLSALVSGLRRMHRALVGRSAELGYALAGELAALRGDPTQLRQVVVNLVVNAFEALPEGRGTIEVRTGMQTLRRDDEGLLLKPPVGGEYVFIEVADDGAGMDLATQAKIFDPFFTTKFTGRGLGLAAVLGIVRSHRGTLRVKSAPGQGTRFSVYFPADRGASGAGASSSVLPAAWRGSGRVLLVDDDNLVRKVTRRMLARLGFEVEEVAAGREARARLANATAPVRAVVLDWTMPDLDGPETVRRLRAVDATVPILMCSGYGPEALGEALTAAGCQGFLRKPFSLDGLRAALRKLLEPDG